MGWGRTLLLGDIGNRLDIADTERDIEALKQEIRGAVLGEMTQDAKIDALVWENAELKLYLASVIRLLVTKGMITPEELTVVVEKVDGEDGSVDGKHDGDIV